MASHTSIRIVALGLIVVAAGAGGYWLSRPESTPPIVGVVRATEVRIAPEVAGQLTAIKVRKGDRVKAGEVVAELSAIELTASVGQARAALAAATADRNNVYAGVRAECSSRDFALAISAVGFLPAADPRIKGTLRAVEDRLLIDNEFVLRYEAENTGDGLPAGEGVFGVQLLACRQLHLAEPLRRSPKLFDRLLSRCNDVGLLAEELDPLTGRMLGNFPQAYSHVGLINCALNLSRQTGPAEERAES